MYLIIIQVELKGEMVLHWWPYFEFSLEEKINLLILQGGSPIEGVIAGDRLAEVVETFSHIRQP